VAQPSPRRTAWAIVVYIHARIKLSRRRPSRLPASVGLWPDGLRHRRTDAPARAGGGDRRRRHRGLAGLYARARRSPALGRLQCPAPDRFRGRRPLDHRIARRNRPAAVLESAVGDRMQKREDRARQRDARARALLSPRSRTPVLRLYRPWPSRLAAAVAGRCRLQAHLAPGGTGKRAGHRRDGLPRPWNPRRLGLPARDRPRADPRRGHHLRRARQPRGRASFYFEHDEQRFQRGLAVLRRVQEHYANDMLPRTRSAASSGARTRAASAISRRTCASPTTRSACTS
jgi:hypothetical protein